MGVRRVTYRHTDSSKEAPHVQKTLAALALMLVTLCGSLNAKAEEDTIKVGILHSLSGTMAISETTLKDVMLMLIEEQNKKAACWAKNWNQWWWTLPPTGPSLQKRPASC
jgi:ABC-type branched-chain amino acid transport systems, periplasmic component